MTLTFSSENLSLRAETFFSRRCGLRRPATFCGAFLAGHGRGVLWSECGSLRIVDKLRSLVRVVGKEILCC